MRKVFVLRMLAIVGTGLGAVLGMVANNVADDEARAKRIEELSLEDKKTEDSEENK